MIYIYLNMLIIHSYVIFPKSDIRVMVNHPLSKRSQARRQSFGDSKGGCSAYVVSSAMGIHALQFGGLEHFLFSHILGIIIPSD